MLIPWTCFLLDHRKSPQKTEVSNRTRMHLEENTEDVAVREANYDHLCQTTSWLSGKTKALA